MFSTENFGIFFFYNSPITFTLLIIFGGVGFHSLWNIFFNGSNFSLKFAIYYLWFVIFTLKKWNWIWVSCVSLFVFILFIIILWGTILHRLFEIFITIVNFKCLYVYTHQIEFLKKLFIYLGFKEKCFLD